MAKSGAGRRIWVKVIDVETKKEHVFSSIKEAIKFIWEENWSRRRHEKIKKAIISGEELEGYKIFQISKEEGQSTIEK